MSTKLCEIKYFFVKKLPKIIYGLYNKNLLFAFHGKYKNFGDQLTPVILDFYGFTTVFAHYKPKYKFSGTAQVVSIGTLLQNTPSDFSGIILGTGADDLSLSFPCSTILAVRGKFTQSNIGMSKKTITLGDPGLLVSFIYPENEKKTHLLGIVPHFVDKNDNIIRTYERKFGDLIKIIDVQRDPVDVIKDIKKCNNIISSSLHGLVIADAYSIPNIMYAIRKNIPPIHDHKYRDYYSAYNMGLNLIEVDGSESLDFFLEKVTSKKDVVAPVQQELHNLFKNFKSYLKAHAPN